MSATVGMSALNERETPSELSPQQSIYASNRRIRPPPIDTTSGSDGRAPTGQKVQRRESKGGLRGMFTRNKSDKNAVSSLSEEPTLASPVTSPVTSPISPRLLSPLEDRLFRNFSISNEQSSPVTPGSAKPNRTPSRINLRSKATKETKPTTKAASKPTPKSTPFEPPPLFQSYPQAIKHARLSASTLSADAVLRIAGHKRSSSGVPEDATEATGQDQGKAEKKPRSKHRRQQSGSISLSKSDWTEKIFVLVTSGYLLQYSGEGNFDRLPEKMLQLGKESVAFASDVIPGKHWVLQVSQSMSADGTPTADSRSLLSRLAFRNADYRRAATSLLLVLDSAEEMDCWIAVLRKEIEALGGKKQVTETGSAKVVEKPELNSQPSHRYLIQKPSDQSSAPCSPRSPFDRRPSWAPHDGIQEEDEEKTSPFLPQHDRLGVFNRPDTGCESVTNSASSYEHYRDSMNRLSYCSSGQRTRVSSPATSPTRDSTSTMDEFPPLSLDTARPRPNASEISERRRSIQVLQGLQNPISQIATPQQILRNPSYPLPPRPLRTTPSTPNFSVPVSSSKRFSSKTPTPESPLLPSLMTSNITETPKRSKKGPPTALSVARPLSPVMDTASPKRGAGLVPPSESSFPAPSRRRASAVDIPSASNSRTARSNSRSPSQRRRASREARTTRRVSSFMPSHGLEVQKADLRRHSSLQTFRQPSPPMESNGVCEFIFPPTIPLSPKPSQDETFESVRETEWERDPLALPPLLELPHPDSPPHPSLRPHSMVLTPPDGPATVLKTDKLSVRATSPRPPRHRPTSTLGPALHYKSSYQSDTGPPRSKNGRGVTNRRSMPVLMHGAPPAPPPNCALPPLPAGRAASPLPVARNNALTGIRIKSPEPGAVGRDVGIKVY
ncbi:peptidase family M20 M25 M40 protein [Rutstroemia sp. NJR-2017a BVV2]|nr:peptidase family M20 M25 M40 protein [Rutstroemia sp. NJR-2017a BVV2]